MPRWNAGCELQYWSSEQEMLQLRWRLFDREGRATLLHLLANLGPGAQRVARPVGRAIHAHRTGEGGGPGCAELTLEPASVWAGLEEIVLGQ